MRYKIVHSEALVGEYEYEAQSPHEALAMYRHDVGEGRIDFGDLEMVDSSDVVEAVKS